ncbi:MAG TPA: DUF2231 domain-containing protein [Anaeromyxobacteraceae bacterium]
MQGPIHPWLVHLPLGLSLAVPLVAAGIALAVRRDLLPRRAWLVVAALQALVLAGSGAAFVSGERDTLRAERVISRRLVREHQKRAEAFLWATAAVLAASAATLFVQGRHLPALAGAAVVGSIAVAVLGIWAGMAGGELVYRHGAAEAFGARARSAAAARTVSEQGYSGPARPGG